MVRANDDCVFCVPGSGYLVALTPDSTRFHLEHRDDCTDTPLVVFSRREVNGQIEVVPVAGVWIGEFCVADFPGVDPKDGTDPAMDFMFVPMCNVLEDFHVRSIEVGLFHCLTHPPQRRSVIEAIAVGSQMQPLAQSQT